MKKITFLGVALLAMSGLAACGGQPSAPSYSGVNTTIDIWATAAEEAVIKEVVDAYNATQEDEANKFSYRFTPVSEGDCGSTLSKDPTVAGAPALALVADDQIYNLQAKDIILEVKGSYKETVVNNNSSVAVQGASYGDKLFGFPVTSDNGYFLWYNKDLLKDNEVGSLETILERAAAQEKTFLLDIGNGWYANSIFHSPQVCGPTSLQWKENAEGKVIYETTWDSDKAAAAAEAVSNLIAPASTAGTFTVGGNDVIVAGFADGTMAAAISGTWMEGDLIEALGGDASKLGAVKLPTFNVNGETCQMGSFSGSKVYVINKTRPVAEQKAAAALADLLTRKDAQLTRFEERSSLPCNNDAAVAPEYTENVTIGGAALNAQNQYAAVQSLSAQDRYWDIGAAIGNAMRTGDLGTFSTWKDFLKNQMDILRAPAA